MSFLFGPQRSDKVRIEINLIRHLWNYGVQGTIHFLTHVLLKLVLSDTQQTENQWLGPWVLPWCLRVMGSVRNERVRVPQTTAQLSSAPQFGTLA